MTTCSSIVALGMMPLLIYIYCKGFPGLENAVPYVGIIMSLVFTLLPCATGIVINHYKPNYTPVVKKVRLLRCSTFIHFVVFTCAFTAVTCENGLQDTKFSLPQPVITWRGCNLWSK